MRLAADSIEGEGDVPLKLGRLHAAELLFGLGEAEAALEILDDAEKSSSVIICDEAQRVRRRLSPSWTPAARAEGASR
jgi:hypothetical protein